MKVALIYSVNINWSFDLSVFTQNRSEVVLRGGTKRGENPSSHQVVGKILNPSRQIVFVIGKTQIWIGRK